jgi:hypothetical protein
MDEPFAPPNTSTTGPQAKPDLRIDAGVAAGLLTAQALALGVGSGLVGLDVPFASRLISVSLMHAALACALWLWPRWFRYLVPLAQGLLGVLLLGTVLLAHAQFDSPIFYLGVLEGTTALCLLGLLWFPRPMALRIVFCALGVLPVPAALHFALVQEELRVVYHARVEQIHAHLFSVFEQGASRVPSLPAPMPPPGAVELDRSWWQLADNDVSGKGRLLVAELHLRLMAPCLPVKPKWEAWLAQEGRDSRSLLPIVMEGLRTCDDVGVDIDAVEHLLLLPFLDRPGVSIRPTAP